MAADNKQITVTPAEFAEIPLDFIISTPLLNTIRAHQLAAESTLNFIKTFNGKQEVFTSKVVNQNGKQQQVTFEVPTLSIVKIPNLKFESMSVSFNYNISQVIQEEANNTAQANLNVETKGILSRFLNAKLTGSIEHTSKRENTANRGGTLEVKVNLCEGETPAGLQKIINALVESVHAVPVPEGK
ncbi:MAG: DUF2589 domain-containing protein [Cytophagales bacterium]|nr:DUF2589 domain-containing protein [Cytophagales bacterium]